MGVIGKAKQESTWSRWCAAMACVGAMMSPVAPIHAQQAVPPQAPNGASGSPAAAADPSPGVVQPPAPGGEAAARPAREFGWSVQPMVHALETITDNGAYGNGGSNRRADLISDLGAGVTVVGRTPRLQVDGSYALRALEYARGTQGNRIEPNGNLNARLEAIDRHLFVDGSLTSAPVLNNPLSTAGGAESTTNTSIVNTERVAPYLLGRLAGGFQYRLRSENGWTQSTSSNSAQSNAYFANHSFDIERVPAPIGAAVTAQREQSNFIGVSGSSTVDDSARFILRAAPWPELTVGARYGVESDNYGQTSGDRNGHIAGVDFAWHPTPRTEAQGFVERRLFGARWHFGAQHRTPFLALDLTSNRVTASSALAQLNLGGREDVRSLLDAIYTTRYPDPVERSRIVGEMAAAEGLPTSLGGPLSVFDRNLARVTEHRFSIAFKGRLSTVGLALFAHRNEVLRSLGDAPVPGTGPIDSFQLVGANVSYTLRLAPQTTGTLSGGSNRTTGLDASRTDQTTEHSVALSFSEHLSAHLDATAGAEHRWSRSNVVAAGRETSLFAGLAWRH